jgi:transitional endoplasmic reticulum ATPase
MKPATASNSPVSFPLLMLAAGAAGGAFLVILARGGNISFPAVLWAMAVGAVLILGQPAATVCFILLAIAGLFSIPFGIPLTLSLIAIGAFMMSGLVKRITIEQLQAQGTSASPAATSGIRFPARQARFDFSAVAGMADFKKRLKEIAEEIREGKNGILFHGDPGNGKTYMAEAFAGELGYAFLPVSYADLADQFVNGTTRNVVDAFQSAIAQAPCVLFLDEMEAYAGERGKSAGYAEKDQTVTAMLTQIEAIRGHDVILMGATNLLDAIDPAIKREGRFDFRELVPNPDLEARIGILSQFLRGTARTVIESMAARWEGFNVVRLRAVGERAAKLFPNGGLTQDDLIAALKAVRGEAGRLPDDALSLEDLVLSSDLRDAFSALAVRMKNVSKIEALGGKVPQGLLLYGPPGTGKTATVKALAKASEWSWIETSGNALLTDPAAIDDVLSKAKEYRPAIVFIDEADDLLASRSGFHPNPTALNKTLAVVSGKTQDVLWVAATNFAEKMDDAALRGGRFEEKLYVGLPDLPAIEELIRRFITKSKARFGGDVETSVVALQLDGLAPADINAILQAAVNIRTGKSVADGTSGAVTLADITEGFRRIKG